MRIPERAILEIQRRARIEDIVGEYVQLTSKGDRLWGLSPFKTEKTPSFSVSPDKGAYYCFSTQKGGGVVNFIMEMEQLSYPDALRFLASKLGMDLGSEDGEISDEFRQKNALAELYQRLTQTFHHFLLKSEEGAKARAYLEKRGVAAESIEKFQLGYVPDDAAWLYDFLTEKKYSRDFLATSGFFGGKNKDWCIFHGRLMFPITNLSGETVAFGGRLLEGEGPKYINSPETALFRKGSTLYALHPARDSIKRNDFAVVCEGYMDVIAMHSAGLDMAIAPLGTAFTPDQATLLRRFSPNLVLLFDSDEAGVRATMKTLGVATRAHMNLHVALIPAGMKDPADILLERGSQELKKIVDYKIDAYNYLLRLVRDQGGGIHSLGGKEKAIQLFVPFWEAIEEESQLLDSVDRFSNLLELDRQAFRKDIYRRLKRSQESKFQPVSAHETPAKRDTIQSQSMLDVRILLATFIYSELFAFLRSSILLEDLQHGWAKDLYIALEESFREGIEDVHQRIERIDEDELKALVRQKVVSGEFSENPELVVKDGLRRIKERNLSLRRDQINYQLRRLLLDPLHDVAAERELLEEKIIVDEALKELRKHIDDRAAE